jgi:hypothetical protein
LNCKYKLKAVLNNNKAQAGNVFKLNLKSIYLELRSTQTLNIIS